MFTHILVSKPDAKVFMGTGYCIGTWAHCARYALQHGIRTTTSIIEF